MQRGTSHFVRRAYFAVATSLLPRFVVCAGLTSLESTCPSYKIALHATSLPSFYLPAASRARVETLASFISSRASACTRARSPLTLNIPSTRLNPRRMQFILDALRALPPRARRCEFVTGRKRDLNKTIEAVRRETTQVRRYVSHGVGERVKTK